MNHPDRLSPLGLWAIVLWSPAVWLAAALTFSAELLYPKLPPLSLALYFAAFYMQAGVYGVWADAPQPAGIRQANDRPMEYFIGFGWMLLRLGMLLVTPIFIWMLFTLDPKAPPVEPGWAAHLYMALVTLILGLFLPALIFRRLLQLPLFIALIFAWRDLSRLGYELQGVGILLLLDGLLMSAVQHLQLHALLGVITMLIELFIFLHVVQLIASHTLEANQPHGGSEHPQE